MSYCKDLGCVLFPIIAVVTIGFLIAELVVVRRFNQYNRRSYRTIFHLGIDLLLCDVSTSPSSTTNNDNNTIENTNTTHNSRLSIMDRMRLSLHVLLMCYFFLLFFLFASVWSNDVTEGTGSITLVCFLQLLGWAMATYVIDLAFNTGFRIGIIHRSWMLFEFVMNSLLLSTIDDLDTGKRFYVAIGIMLLAMVTVSCFWMPQEERESVLPLDEISLIRNRKMHGGIPLLYPQGDQAQEEPDASNEYGGADYLHVHQQQQEQQIIVERDSNSNSNSSSPVSLGGGLRFDSRYHSTSSAAITTGDGIDGRETPKYNVVDVDETGDSARLGFNDRSMLNIRGPQLWSAAATETMKESGQTATQGDAAREPMARNFDIPQIIAAKRPLPRNVHIVSAKVDSWSNITTTNGETYVGYVMILRSSLEDSWVVIKRYGECSSLNDKLLALFDTLHSASSNPKGYILNVPPFPSRRSIKKFISQTLNGTAFLNERAKELDIWLQGLVYILPNFGADSSRGVESQIYESILDFLQPLVIIPKSESEGSYDNQAKTEEAVRQGLMQRSVGV